MTEVVTVRGLGKSFGGTRALDGLDLSVQQGEIHGFLGPNGAGKSTTLRVLLGLLRADAGTVRVLGRDPWKDPAELHRRVAYVPGEVALWPNLTGGETIDLLGRMRGGIDPATRARLVEQFELDPTRPCRTYSKGNRQKVALIAALASDAELLLLDEPTAGLDPLKEEVFRQVVRAGRTNGTTVLLSSHILAEVEALADTVSIVRAGRTVETGTLAQLRHLSGTSITAELDSVPAGLDTIAGVRDLHAQGLTVRFSVDKPYLDEALRVLVGAGVRSLSTAPPTLEELFLRHYTGSPAAERMLR